MLSVADDVMQRGPGITIGVNSAAQGSQERDNPAQLSRHVTSDCFTASRTSWQDGEDSKVGLCVQFLSLSVFPYLSLFKSFS